MSDAATLAANRLIGRRVLLELWGAGKLEVADGIGLYITPVQTQFWEELKTHPNIPYKPFGAGSYEEIPPEYR